jgi:DNA polymerase-3 subunit epsilon
MTRQIFIDTETTGLQVENGHRIIEIACMEMIDRKLTGREFHYYINPEREIEAGALAIHGISNEFLLDKPFFKNIAGELIEFIENAELIIHNAPFDVSFINNELILTQQGWKSLLEYCQITDTLAMARSMHAGQRNSLDALCKRYGIDHSKRVLHGALVDTYLLSQVYLAMTGGQSDFFDMLIEKNSIHTPAQQMSKASIQHEFIVLKANDEELLNHQDYLQMLKKQGKCTWIEENTEA